MRLKKLLITLRHGYAYTTKRWKWMKSELNVYSKKRNVTVKSVFEKQNNTKKQKKIMSV